MAARAPFAVLVLLVVAVSAESIRGDVDVDLDELMRDRNFTFGGPEGVVQWLQGVYAPGRWSAAALAAAPLPCAQQLALYRDALNRGDEWAQKVADASGRYAAQFFFGNDFWLGSLKLCEELQAAAAAPFDLAFALLQLRLQLAAVPAQQPAAAPGAGAMPAAALHPELGARVVSLGACLPAACAAEDLRPVLEAGRPAHGPRSLRVLTARRVPGPYRLTADFKFHVLGGVTATLLLLLAAGTTYELRQRAAAPRDAEGHSKGGADKKAGGGLPAPPVGLAGRLLMGFSAISNGQKILQSKCEENLACIHGLRFLSLAWVILVHTYLNVFSIADNKGLRAVTERNTLFQTVSNATYSVDTFFFISGLLMTFVFFRNKDKAGDSIVDSSFGKDARQFVLLLTYRLSRLTPAYLFVLGGAELSMRWVVNSSVFTPKLADHITCDRYWWRNALYVNNLFPRSEMCMLWSWYMANDTQFYILGLLLVIFATRYFWLVVASWGVFLVSSWVTTAFISVHYEYIVRVQDPFGLFDELYDKPWMRVGPYLVGMAVGWYLQTNKCKIRMNLAAACAGWALSLGIFAALVYSVLHAHMTVTSSAAYVALGHSAWGAALGWIVISCCSGYGGFINKILSFRGMVPLSRLTYCAYLVHPIIMTVITSQMDGPLHLHTSMVVASTAGVIGDRGLMIDEMTMEKWWNEWQGKRENTVTTCRGPASSTTNFTWHCRESTPAPRGQMIIFLGNLVMSYIISFVICLVLEAPLVCILKVIIEPRKKAQ